MNKRNMDLKISSQRPSTTNLDTKAAKQKSRTSRSGNRKNCSHNDLQKPMSQSNSCEAHIPKTRFNSRDRPRESHSNSSPRLKSFPAEKIKRLDNPVLFSPRPSAIMANPNTMGDSFPASQQPVMPITQDSTPIQNGYNGEKILSVEDDQNCLNEKKLHSTYDKQPIGGRNALMHRRAVELEKQKGQMLQTQMQSPRHENLYAYGQMKTNLEQIDQHQQNSMQQQLMQQQAMDQHLQMNNPQQAVSQQLQANAQQRAIGQQLLSNGQQQAMTQQLQANTQQQAATPVNQGPYYNYYTHPNQSYSGVPMASSQGWSMNPNLPTNSNAAAKQLPQNQKFSGQQEQPQQLQQPQIDNHQSIERPQAFANQSSPVAGFQAHPHSKYMPGSRSNPNTKKKMLPFTSSMVRDQELLLATLQQQGVPDEIVVRQFESLLNEQQKQLANMEQRDEQNEGCDTNYEAHKRAAVALSNGKPNWMANITPSRDDHASSTNKMAEQTSKENNDHNSLNNSANYSSQQFMMQQAYGQGKINQYPAMETGQQMSNRHHPHHHQSNYQTTNQPIYQKNQENAPQRPVADNTMSQQQVLAAQSINQSNYPENQYNNSYQAYQQHSQYPPSSVNYNFAQQPYQQNGAFARKENNPQNKVFPPNEAQQSNNLTVQRENAGADKSRQCSMQNHSGNATLKNQSNEAKYRNQIESYSLLKLRLYKDKIREQQRNNGLQDPETIQKTIGSLQDLAKQKGYEYLQNLNNTQARLKLDGTLDSDRIAEMLPSGMTMENPPGSLRRRIPANGLENGKNANNPPRAPPVPAQQLNRNQANVNFSSPGRNMNNNCYTMTAERENGTVAPVERQDRISAPNSIEPNFILPKQPDQMVATSNGHQYLQQYFHATPRYNVNANSANGCNQLFNYSAHQNSPSNSGQGDTAVGLKNNVNAHKDSNRADGDARDAMGKIDNPSVGFSAKNFQPLQNAGNTHGVNYYANFNDIQEPRTIGGITYLARKPSYIPNQNLLPNTIPMQNIAYS